MVQNATIFSWKLSGLRNINYGENWPIWMYKYNNVWCCVIYFKYKISIEKFGQANKYYYQQAISIVFFLLGVYIWVASGYWGQNLVLKVLVCKNGFDIIKKIKY